MIVDFLRGAEMEPLDRQIVGCLLADGRATYAEIGDQVGLSAPAVKRRVDRLVESGAVRGFTAVIDPAAMGWQVEAYVEVYCKDAIGPDQLRRSFERIPEVVSACTVSGSADALVHMLAESIYHLERAIERMREEPNFEHTESVIVLSRLIHRPRP